MERCKRQKASLLERSLDIAVAMLLAEAVSRLNGHCHNALRDEQALVGWVDDDDDVNQEIYAR